jgi:hypothetical protein
VDLIGIDLGGLASGRTHADAEFVCFTRRGQALSLLLDEWPTYGYFPQVYYYRLAPGKR